MKTLIAATAALLLAWFTTPVDAYVVEVTTTVSLADAEDHAQLRKALQAAVDDVLKEAIAFQPTLVVLTKAMVVGDRLHVRLLIADQDGERAIEELNGESGSASPEMERDGETPAKKGELKI